MSRFGLRVPEDPGFTGNLESSQEVNSIEQKPSAARLGNPRETEAEATLTHLSTSGHSQCPDNAYC